MNKPRPRRIPRPASPPRRRWLQAAALLASAAALPVRALQAIVGHAVSVLDFDSADPARQREVPMRLYLPAHATAAEPVPLVVFSHGIGGSRSGYSYLGRHWAGQGFASLHVQHVGSDRSLWFGNIFSLVTRLQGAAQDGEAVARVLDLRFALDELLTGPTGRQIDTSRIAVAGHSYGANTTLLAAGARVRRPDKPIDLHEPRFKAAIIISAPPFYGDGKLAAILSPISVPSLHITATEDVIRIPGYYSGAADRLAVFDAIGSQRKWLAVFEGGSHSMFTDRSGTGGVLLNPQVKAATQDLSAAFLRQVFAGDDSALRGWPQRHAGIVARVDGW